MKIVFTKVTYFTATYFTADCLAAGTLDGLCVERGIVHLLLQLSGAHHEALLKYSISVRTWRDRATVPSTRPGLRRRESCRRPDPCHEVMKFKAGS